MSPHGEEERRRAAALGEAGGASAAAAGSESEEPRESEGLEPRSADLARSLAVAQATLEATSDAILATDDQGRVTAYNTNFARLWRMSREIFDRGAHGEMLEIMARRTRDPAAFLARVAELEQEGPVESFDILELSDGRVIERYSRIPFVDRHPAGRVWSFRDITDRRFAAQEHAYLAAIVASSSDGIVSKTLDGVVTSWNAAAERIFGWPAGEAIGQPLTIVIPPELWHEEAAILARLRRGERISTFETVRMRRDGTPIKVSLTISPVKDDAGRIIGASKIVRDVTERDQLLAREQHARARAEEASRLKDEFLATVSHELRTPLNAILGWAQILTAGKIDEARMRHAIEVIERNARTQAQVIEDLLDVSRIITGKLRLDVHVVMPARAIEAALETIRPSAEAKSIRLHAVLDESAGPISGDPSRLQQIAWNLLSNAIKFTPKGGRVEVRLERVESHVEIVVSDTGEGISPDFLPHVFDRFRQADATPSRATSGLGLGLAIVRHLVELHGGGVSAESAGAGRGATFRVSLPLRPVQPVPESPGSSTGVPHENAEPGGAARSPSLLGVRVLIVDDEADTREVLRHVLEDCGAQVFEAASAEQALQRIREARPSVLVSDIGMPGEDGYSLIRRLREWERETGTWTPAVALTAYARSEDRVRALRAGFQIHVTKPIEPTELALVIAGVAGPGPHH